MPKINPEAQLAVKLYRQRIIRLGYTEKFDYASQNVAVIDAGRLMSMARSLRRRYTDKSNRPLTPKELKALSKLEQALSTLIGQYGLQADVNDDARGYAVYIHFPDRSYNSMGGAETGWGI